MHRRRLNRRPSGASLLQWVACAQETLHHHLPALSPPSSEHRLARPEEGVCLHRTPYRVHQCHPAARCLSRADVQDKQAEIHQVGSQAWVARMTMSHQCPRTSRCSLQVLALSQLQFEQQKSRPNVAPSRVAQDRFPHSPAPCKAIVPQHPQSATAIALPRSGALPKQMAPPHRHQLQARSPLYHAALLQSTEVVH